MAPHVYDMVQYIETKAESDYSNEMKEFLNVVPDALDFERWLLDRQKKWSDGTTFGSPVGAVQEKRRVPNSQS